MNVSPISQTAKLSKRQRLIQELVKKSLRLQAAQEIFAK